jgi:hypothetical protein
MGARRGDVSLISIGNHSVVTPERPISSKEREITGFEFPDKITEIVKIKELICPGIIL